MGISKTLRHLLIMFAIAVLVAACGGQPSGGGGGDSPGSASDLGIDRLNYGVSIAGSSLNIFNIAAAEVIEEELGIPVTVVESEGCGDNFRKMATGERQIGFSCFDVAYRAVNGTGEFEGEAVPELRHLFGYTVVELNFVVTEDSGVTSLEELEGKRFSPGSRGTTTEISAESALTALGITPDYYRGSAVDAVEAIKNREIIGYVKAGVGFGLDGTTQEIAATQPIRILGFTDEQVEIVKAAHPDFIFGTVPAGVAGPDVDAYNTIMVPGGVAVMADFPEEAAYQITKVVLENQDRIAESYPAVAGVDMIGLTMEYLLTPLHPGAIRYYEEIGVEIPEHLYP